MSKTFAGLLLIALSGLLAAPLAAFEDGDFAPRGTLLYSRINDTSKAYSQLGGDNWKDHVERMLMVRSERDFEETEPLFNEIRRFVDHMGLSETIIADVMIREPFVQSATITHLKEGAPTEFSEEFVAWLKEQNSELEISPTSISYDGGKMWLQDGVMIQCTEGMIQLHIEDVLDGYTDESLSQVESFRKWSSKASGDIVALADMKAWRAGIDRLGEEFDDDIREVLDFVEWQKWESIQLNITLPRESSGGIRVDAALYLNQPFERLNKFMKPAGGSRLVDVLPAETLGFISAQLGRDHERTYNDILGFFHSFEQNQRPDRMRRNIEWMKDDLEYSRERLKELENEDEKDEDTAPDPRPQDGGEKFPGEPMPKGEEGAPEDEAAMLRREIADLEERIAELEERLAEFRSTPFDPATAKESKDKTEAEEFHVELERALEEFGITRAEVQGALGQEAIAGFVGLPDPYPTEDDLDDAFEDMWFVIAETTEKFPELKDRFLDRFLGRSLPEDATEEQKEQARRAAEGTVFKKVDGGEILRGKGLRQDACFFAGQGFAGVAANEDVARLLLKAGMGTGRMGTMQIPGGVVSGSKFAYLNLRDTLQRVIDGEYNRRRGYHEFPRPYFDLEKWLPEGAHLSLSTDESSHALLFTLRTGGVENLNSTLEMLAEEMLTSEHAYDHDRDMLYELENALNQWYGDNEAALKEMGESERATLIKGVTPQSLMDAGLFSPLDGMRSCFDPAMKERYEAMLASYAKRMGPGEGVEDDPTDLSESGFEWFGLPGELEGESTGDMYEMRRGRTSAHVVIAMKGPWAHNGRLVVLWDNGRANTAWFAEEDYQSFREARASGKAWQGPEIKPDKMPDWKKRKVLLRKQDDMWSLRYELEEAAQRASEAGEKFDPSFDGSTEEKPGHALRELLGMGEDSWWWFEDADALKISKNDDGDFTARFEKWGEWIEITPDGEVVSSMDDK